MPETVDYENTIRRLLHAIRGGDRTAFDALIEAVGHELRKLSAYRIRRQPIVQTLQTTALVNEVVLRLIQMLNNDGQPFPATKEHFMALASRMMRFTLTDYARKKRVPTVSIDEAPDGRPWSDSLPDWSERDLDNVLALDGALKTIER